eukprot:462212_1
MAHDVIETRTFFWITRSLDIFCSSSILIMIFYHIFILYSHRLERKKENDSITSVDRSRSTRKRAPSTVDREMIKKWSKILHFLTILFMCFSFITIFLLTLNIWSIFPLYYDCDTIVYVLCLAFHLSKSVFYFILIVRLQVAFGTSAFGYSRCQINSLFAFVGIYTIFVLVGTPFVVYGKWVTDPHNWCHIHISEGSMYISIGILVWIIMDMLISIWLLYLFQKPIRVLLSMINVDKKLADLMIKYSILSWASIILSIISMLLYLWKHITTLIEINVPITCLCVILMHIKYNNVYENCCYLCIQCFVRANNKPEKNIKIDTKAAVVSNNNEKYLATNNKQGVHIPQDSNTNTTVDLSPTVSTPNDPNDKTVNQQIDVAVSTC